MSITELKRSASAVREGGPQCSTAQDGVLARNALLFAITRDGFDVDVLDLPLEASVEPTMLKTARARDAKKWAVKAFDLTDRRFNSAIRRMESRGEVMSFELGRSGSECIVPAVPADADRNMRTAVIKSDHCVLSKFRKKAKRALPKCAR